MFSFRPVNVPQILDNHLSVQATAEYSGYSEQYIRRLLRNRKLEGIKIGHLWLVEKNKLDTYINLAQKTTDRRFGSRNPN